ncbi:hypothetical protein [Gimesia aquarii]|uniref:Uncharacterized protein n=1 Tax=Gimesia aquarii TaxID=2527964 RepID=A0A517WSB0_9PLAN|nr:hypothetical protein [Gimesia aquarii]QDU08141.1 hypothetical protein V202x_15050 [Gimesia aquarii]
MSEKERADEDIRVFNHKFKWESLRSVVFWSFIALATLYIFKPHELQDSIKQLELELGNQIKGKMFEQRVGILDDFIVKSDAYTKHVNVVAEHARPADYHSYEEEFVNSYNLQLARMRAVFGDAIESEIQQAKAQRKALHKALRVMKQYKDETKKDYTVRPLEGIEIENVSQEREALVNKNIAITERAIQLQFSGIIEEDSNVSKK